MRLLTNLFLIVAILTLGSSVTKGDINPDAGTTAFPFLKIGVSARAISMGGAFTGLADDASALYYNPAGVAGFNQDRYIAGYHNYFMDIQSGFAGYVWNLGEQHAIAGQISYLNYGEFIEADSSGTETGRTFGGGDIMFAATYARKLGSQTRAGITAKFIYENIDEFSATGVAFDLGAQYLGERERYGAGILIQNIGKQLSALGTEKYDLPITIRTGGFFKPRGLPMTLTADIILPSDNDPIFAFGGEYVEFKPIYLRLGWNSFGSNYRTTDSDDSWAGLSMGVGFDYRSIHIAYAYTPAAELGESHRITVTGGLFR